MLHNDAAQQRPGKKPASAPEASQKPPRAQGRANLKIPTLNRISSQPGDTTAASLTDRNMDTPHIIHIHGRHSLLTRLPLTTPSTTRRVQYPQSPTILRQEPRLLPQPARYHSFGEGHVQARSVLGLEHCTEQTQLPQHETKYLQQNLKCSAHAQKLTEPWPDRVQGSTENLRQQPTPLPRLARHHPFGRGHVPARSVLGLEQGTEQGQLPRHATEGLQQNPEQSQHQKKKLVESGHNTWTHQASHADSNTHSIHTAPPVPRHPNPNSDILQSSLNEKYRHSESAPWSARHHPLGEGHGQTCTVLGLVQGSAHGLPYSTHET